MIGGCGGGGCAAPGPRRMQVAPRRIIIPGGRRGQRGEPERRQQCLMRSQRTTITTTMQRHYYLAHDKKHVDGRQNRSLGNLLLKTKIIIFLFIYLSLSFLFCATALTHDVPPRTCLLLHVPWPTECWAVLLIIISIRRRLLSFFRLPALVAAASARPLPRTFFGSRRRLQLLRGGVLLHALLLLLQMMPHYDHERAPRYYCFYAHVVPYCSSDGGRAAAPAVSHRGRFVEEATNALACGIVKPFAADGGEQHSIGRSGTRDPAATAFVAGGGGVAAVVPGLSSPMRNQSSLLRISSFGRSSHLRPSSVRSVPCSQGTSRSMGTPVTSRGAAGSGHS